jgi:MOSC domain-containing protein YiiM
MNHGSIEALFVYPTEGGPAEPRSEVTAQDESGLVDDQPRAPKRAITLLSFDQWEEVQDELGVRLPLETRRSNVIVKGVDLPATMGKRVRLGEVEIEIRGETTPCDVMDEAHPGLRAVLATELRAGVHGSIVRTGAIRVGDAIEVVE